MKFVTATPVLILLAVGCQNTAKNTLVMLQDWKPDGLPSEKQELVLGGTKLPVDVKASNRQGNYEIELLANDVVVDKETYVVHPGSFELASMGEESLNPPLPVLKDDIRVGDSWNWEGKLTFGLARTCSAKITTSTDKLYAGVVQQDTLLVEVKLKMDSGAPNPAERRLRFWFVQGKGLVKREFGSGSIREPVSE